MKRKLFSYLPLLLLSATIAKAQLNENFIDSNFTADPVWVGSTNDWIIDPSLQLQSNDTVANSSFYLSTSNTLAIAAQWELYVQLKFNTSSANYVDVYLTASASDLTKTTTAGYFVRIGSTNDDICLYRKDPGGTIVKIIDGVNGILNTSNNILKIKVTRDAADNWILYRDITGTGMRYFEEGAAVDTTYATSSFFGILVKQSTASFFKKHFFDGITITPFVPDTTPPQILSATGLSLTKVDVLFDEALDSVSCNNVLDYSADNGLGNPIAAVQDTANPALVHLIFAEEIPNGIDCRLTINGVKDVAGNAINDAAITFYFYEPQQYDVLIDEIMADPTPPVGLPNNEWIELKNVSSFPINLKGFTISNATTQSGTMPNLILQPDSFVIVCTSNAVAAMSAFGTAIPVTGFPTLDNAVGEIVLANANGKTIHAVDYAQSWYQNVLKEQGGWSLEMIDTKNPCSGSTNWQASIDPKGGTPGKMNSIKGDNADTIAPQLYRAYAADSLHLTLYFDEPLDSLKATTTANYTISDGIGIPQSTVALAPFFDKVELQLATPLSPNKIYTITANNVTDCVGNTIGKKDTADVGLSLVADSFDVIINEILFNPKPNGVDYVELYNRSNKIINLKQIYIANRNSTGDISSIAQLSADDRLLFPQGFAVATTSPDVVQSQYMALDPDAFVTLSNLPSFDDANGDVIVLNAQGNIVDELKYDAGWQFKLIDNPQGVSLERIDYDAPTQLQSNWHSAATSVGYGTPTYKNSQYRIDGQAQGELSVSPEIISPDNDGVDDFATIDYRFPDPGYVANITVFDGAGRPVRSLEHNALCGTKGSFQWDGLGDKNQKLPIGIYIVYTQVFDLSGKTATFKNVLVLARKN